MEYLLHGLILICIYAILAVSLDLIAGHAGLLSVMHAAFFGLGAYTSALLVVQLRQSFIVSMLAGVVVVAVFAFIISLSTLHLRDDYFVISTFGFQIIIFSILNNWMGLTRGPLGINNIPPPVIFGWTVQSRISFLLMSIVFAVCTYSIINRIAMSPFGRVLRAIREDELFAQSVGKNTFKAKIAAFVVSAIFASVAGGLYAHYITYIAPGSFSIMESILVLTMVIIGGAGSRWGPVIGAVVIVALPETLRFLGLPDSIAANLRQIIYGILLVVMMVFRRHGILGKYSFGHSSL